ncbi:MAG: NAD(P)/FAD-dependent oxidoreductase [Planctomycetota bacterium]|jgi:protoporphyrinogen oxidase
MSTHYGIVGGGILGMTLAQRLVEAGEQVTLFEAAPQLGGLADAWQLGDVTWDRHYHVTLLSDMHWRNQLAELGLEDEMNWVETKTGFFTDGQLYSMSNNLEFLRFPPLGLIDKFRLGATIFYASKLTDWKKLEQTPVADWLRRLSGRRTFEKIWLPLLRAKLGENYTKTSAAFIWATIARMYAARRTGLKKEMFGYVRGGYARILDRWTEQLVDLGVDVHTSEVTQRVTTSEGGLPVVETESHRYDDFDRVILTTPSPVISRLCPDLSDDELARHNGLQYQGIVCASVLLKQPLAQFYVTNITDSWVPFTAVIEMSTLVDREEFGERNLVYLPKYVSPDDPLFDESDESIRERFLAALEKMYPHFSRDDVIDFRLSRVRNVVSLSTLRYSENLPPIHTSLPGVYAINSAHIVNGTLNVNDTVKLGQDVAQSFLLSQTGTHAVPAQC